jgi:hypothetical protein
MLLNHGDFWSNNILWRKDTSVNATADVEQEAVGQLAAPKVTHQIAAIIDWQICKPGSRFVFS